MASKALCLLTFFLTIAPHRLGSRTLQTSSKPPCRTNLTIYLDRSGTMFHTGRKSTRFREALDSLEKAFSDEAKYHNLSVSLKLFASRVLPDAPQNFDFDSGGRESLRLSIAGLRGLKSLPSDEDRTNIADVLADIMKIAKKQHPRDVFLIISDFVHDNRQRETPGNLPSLDEWERDLDNQVHPQVFAKFFSDKGETRKILLLMENAETGNQQLQDVVRRDLSKLGGSHVNSFSSDELEESLEAALNPVTLRFRRSTESKVSLEAVLEKQSCGDDNIYIEGLMFSWPSKASESFLVKQLVKDAPLSLPIGKGALRGLSDGYGSAFAFKKRNNAPIQISNAANFNLGPYIRLNGARAVIENEAIRVTPLVSGQPPFTAIKATIITPSDSSERPKAESSNLINERSYSEAIGMLRMDESVAFPQFELSIASLVGENLCDERNHELLLSFSVEDDEGAMTSNSLKMRLDGPPKDASRDFFEHAALPGVLFMVLLIVMAANGKRIDLAYLVENLHMLLAIITSVFGIFYLSSLTARQVEKFALSNVKLLSTGLLALTWMLVVVMLWRLDLWPSPKPATVEWKIKNGMLVKDISLDRLLRRFLMSIITVMACFSVYDVWAHQRPLEQCTYLSENFEDTWNDSNISL